MAEFGGLRYFTDEECEKLIELVQNCPLLYNSSLQDYRNNCLRAEAWINISGQFSDCVPNDVAFKWKNLKVKFIKLRKLDCQEALSGSSSELASTKWNLYEHMCFLNEHVSDRQFFTEEDCEKLIELVQKHPVLYDPSVGEYKNDIVRARAWMSISVQFSDCDENDVAYKWKALKEKFIRLRKLDCRGARSDSSSKVASAKWRLYEHLSFLNKHIKHRQRSNNVRLGRVVKVRRQDPAIVEDMDVLGLGEAANSVDMEDEASSFLELSLGSAEPSPTELDSIDPIQIEPSPTAVAKQKTDFSHHGTARKKSRPIDVVVDGTRNPVLKECQEFCDRYAHQMASIKDPETREKLKNEMEKLYVTIKFSP